MLHLELSALLCNTRRLKLIYIYKHNCISWWLFMKRSWVTKAHQKLLSSNIYATNIYSEKKKGENITPPFPINLSNRWCISKSWKRYWDHNIPQIKQWWSLILNADISFISRRRGPAVDCNRCFKLLMHEYKCKVSRPYQLYS